MHNSICATSAWFSPMSMTKVLRAARRAALWHDGQRRKGEKKEPYFTHLADVALLSLIATSDPDVIAAAFLHDAIEDQGITAEQIEREFGSEVAALVVAMSDNKALSYRARKQAQIDKAPGLSPKAKIIKLADKTANLQSILHSPPKWPTERKLAYAAWARQVVRAMGEGQNPHLLMQFNAAADAVESNEARR